MKIDYASHIHNPPHARPGIRHRLSALGRRAIIGQTPDSLPPIAEFGLIVLLGWLAGHGAWQAPHIMAWLGLPVKFSPVLHAAMVFITLVSLRAPFVFLRSKRLRQIVDGVVFLVASMLVIRHMPFVIEMPMRYMNYQGLFEIPLVHA